MPTEIDSTCNAGNRTTLFSLRHALDGIEVADYKPIRVEVYRKGEQIPTIAMMRYIRTSERKGSPVTIVVEEER